MSKIKDVFKDYKEENNIINAEVTNINLFKKSKKLELEINTQYPIKIDEISSFEEYLKNTFQIQKVFITIENSNKNLFKLEEDWQDIVKYISKSFPIAKVIFKESTLEIEENKITIVLRTKGLDFLCSNKIDKEIEHIVYNLYGIKTRVEYIENVTEELIQEQEKYLEDLEKNACDDLMSQINVQNEPVKKIEQEEQNNSDNKDSIILGRNKKTKEPIVKIVDLSVDYGKIIIEGKITNINTRELKNGKTLIAYDVYDGTSTITCKSFVEMEKINKVMRKIKRG